jgi:hypothetical protein
MHDLAKPILEAVNRIVGDRTVDRPTLIEALEDVQADLESLLDSLKDEQHREDAQ